MKRTVYLFTATLFLLFYGLTLSAQVKIDVKTKWSEKKELTVLKHGVIEALDVSVKFDNVEFGEDYALWLRDLKRWSGEGDTIVLELTLEVREASLFQEGTLLSTGKVRLSYDSRTLDSIGNNPDLLRSAEDYQQMFDLLNKLIAEGAGAIVPKAQPLIASLVGLFLKEYNSAPELREIYEGILVGTEVVIALDRMVGEG